MINKANLKGVRPLTLAELHARRALREQGKKPPRRPKRKVGRPSKGMSAKKTFTVSLTRELASRAKWDIGHGNFSYAVEKSLTTILAELDRARRPHPRLQK